MAWKTISAVALSCAAMMAFSLPANATPKTECDSGLQRVETHLETNALGRDAVDRVRRSLTNAKKFQEEKKYKKCAEIVNNMIKVLDVK